MDSVEDAKIARVENWLVENVRVITQANELTLSDFTYNCKSYNGQFSISVDGEALEGRWRFNLETRSAPTREMRYSSASAEWLMVS